MGKSRFGRPHFIHHHTAHSQGCNTSTNLMLIIIVPVNGPSCIHRPYPSSTNISPRSSLHLWPLTSDLDVKNKTFAACMRCVLDFVCSGAGFMLQFPLHSFMSTFPAVFYETRSVLSSILDWKHTMEWPLDFGKAESWKNRTNGLVVWLSVQWVVWLGLKY